MDIQIASVTSEHAIQQVADLATIIWHSTYDSLLPAGQVDYMLNKFQSKSAVFHQINEENHLYYLLVYQNETVGFFAVRSQYQSVGKLFLSKIYLASHARGKGIIRRAFAFIENLALENDCKQIWLTVNKENLHAQEVYRHFGFHVIKSTVSDIGGGYVMDDYVFEKQI
ncbi:GNAT family N-acetyltransferase [Scatolibacter rhodanostii]|uniref:GNAT family N-acetyltransferase n=1 Tax=Scatolibacter rhodanostii TaxID=2014781 RepID=UPI000C0846FE|nr:GNAT family N-acetyltransferase [Scatolibacter rhodanostii]